MHRCYKPFPNGWFMALFSPHYSFLSHSPSPSYPNHPQLSTLQDPRDSRNLQRSTGRGPWLWYLLILDGWVWKWVGKIKINHRHLGVHYVQTDPYLVSFIIYLSTLVEHWTHLNASRILRIECAFSGQWSNKQRPNLVVIPSTKHIIKMLSCGSWNPDLLGPTCCMCGVKHNPHHRNRKSNWWSRKKGWGDRRWFCCLRNELERLGALSLTFLCLLRLPIYIYHDWISLLIVSQLCLSQPCLSLEHINC